MTNFNHMSVFVYVTFLFTYVKTVRNMGHITKRIERGGRER